MSGLVAGRDRAPNKAIRPERAEIVSVYHLSSGQPPATLAVLQKINQINVRYLLILFIFLSGCLADQNISLVEDEIINKHFEAKEIDNLGRILSFFDKEVQFITNENGSIEGSYNKLFETIKDSAKVSDPYSPILKIRSEGLNQLFSSLPESLKNEIWDTYYSVRSSTDDSLIVFDINPSGKYGAFLKSASQENQMLVEYQNAFEHAGITSPAMEAGMIMNPEQLNLNKERERLIVAVHYLAIKQTKKLRDQSKRKDR